MRVVIINGSGTVGKDTFCSFCSDYLPEQVEVMSTVDVIKEVATRFGYNGIKTEVNRRFLSDLKDLVCEYNPNFSIEEVRKKIQKLKNLTGTKFETKILFVHAREPRDIERLKQSFSAETILITNKNVPVISSNHADRDVFEYDYDYTIDNSGSLEELRAKAISFCQMKN